MTNERLTINGDTVRVQSNIMGKIEVPITDLPRVYNEHERHLEINKLKVVLNEQEATKIEQLL